MQYAWRCSCCGKQYDTLPLSFAAEAPEYWYDIPAGERERRAVLTPDFCTLDDRYYFIGGCLELPILGTGEKFVFGVWVSLSEASMRRAEELSRSNMSDDDSPAVGWLSTNIRFYPGALRLKAAVHSSSANLGPICRARADRSPALARSTAGDHDGAGAGDCGRADAPALTGGMRLHRDANRSWPHRFSH